MPLNLDKLKALIRLANNNPNEHEANLAARRVCRELTLSDVEHLSGRTAAGKINEAILKEYTDPTTGDLIIRISKLDLHAEANSPIIAILKSLKNAVSRPKTWNDVRRSSEPQWRTSPPPNTPPKDEYRGTSYDHFGTDFDLNEFLRRHGVHFKGGQRGGKSWTDSAPHVDAPEDNDWVHWEPFTKNKKEKRKQELRVCTKCGFETMTFRIDEVPWICNPCHWKEKL